MNNNDVIKKVKEAVSKCAEDARTNAGYSGSWDDGGAAQTENLLKYWLDGIEFASTGKTKVYKQILKKIEEESDPEFSEYKKLKEKFNK